jgi:hypothetical protein
VLTDREGEGLKMDIETLTYRRLTATNTPQTQDPAPQLDMTKAYYRFRLRNSNVGGFSVGLANFACLGVRRFDVAGYPYDDEFDAIYSDWVKLGQDIKKAEETITGHSERSAIKSER